MIINGTRSVGIVGPFGTGKTSLVKWITNRLGSETDSNCQHIVCYHSCWGFKNSDSAIHDMLASAVLKLNSHIDTFQVTSLPDSYRKMFSAGGTWIETISNLVLSRSKPEKAFEHLSRLLKGINGKIVFIVEDLDRADTKSFEIQEVLAFHERLKEYDNLSFILTGGRSSSQKIDYVKLCDHLEDMKLIHPQQSSFFIGSLCQRCLNEEFFPHEKPGKEKWSYDWNPITEGIMIAYNEVTLPSAVASLLNTPRSLRHALARTYDSWATLHGEINFYHLLAVNVLRYGAPECFQFLWRYWDRLHSTPTSSQDRRETTCQPMIDDWERTIQNVEWDPTAALQVMNFILPLTGDWLKIDVRSWASGIEPQGVHQERYWRRAFNETIGENDVRDQDVINETKDWIKNPRLDSPLVKNLCTCKIFCEVWGKLAGNFLTDESDKSQILLLCEHVITRILDVDKVSACSDSQGFVTTYSFATRKVRLRSENAQWLKKRITQACSVSIAMVNGLWRFYGNSKQTILLANGKKPVRQHVINELKKVITNGESLTARLTPDNSATLNQLVFDPGNEDNQILVDVQSWLWLGSVILEALRNRNVSAVVNCGSLLGPHGQMAVNLKVLNGFFGNDAEEVIDILAEMVDQLPESDQALIRNVVGAARMELASEGQQSEEDGESDRD